MNTSTDSLLLEAAATLDRVRTQRPAVQCVTNTVVMNLTANTLLAVGAVPSMSVAADEVGDFVASASALLVNVGTIDPGRRAAIDIAVSCAEELGRPWVLDPVLVDRASGRLRFALELVRRQPTVVRGNAAELGAIGAALGEPASAETAAGVRALAVRCGSTLAVTGAPDRVAGQAPELSVCEVANGVPMMTRVTGIGCAAGALVAACLAASPGHSTLAVTRDALLVLGVAGEIALEASNGPGSFGVALLDALYALDVDALAERGRIVVV